MSSSTVTITQKFRSIRKTLLQNSNKKTFGKTVNARKKPE